MARSGSKRHTISLSKSDLTEIYYAVELKRLSVAEDNRQNGRHADGVDLAAWRRQMERCQRVGIVDLTQSLNRFRTSTKLFGLVMPHRKS
jgi:hypothetical protein